MVYFFYVVKVEIFYYLYLDALKWDNKKHAKWLDFRSIRYFFEGISFVLVSELKQSASTVEFKGLNIWKLEMRTLIQSLPHVSLLFG